MTKGILIWAIAATLLAGFFLWRYEKKACIENVVNNIVDTALIYIPMQGGLIKNSSNPFDFKIPSIADQHRAKNMMLTGAVNYDPIEGVSYGIGLTYLRPKWSLGYSYDVITKDHSIIFGWRF